MFGLIDNVLSNPKDYVREVLSNSFVDVSDGVSIFKGIQPRDNDEFEKKVLSIFKSYKVAFNFIRQSSYLQGEPNYLHTDEMMGDVTVLFYLNENYPEGAGTTVYIPDGIKVIDYKFNRMCWFDSKELHSRNIKENFGVGDEARLVQVIFLKEI
jgi:hypothetical protein